MADHDHRPVNIAPLKLDTDDERRIFKQGEENYKAKKARAKIGLLQNTPNDEESDLIHQMWLQDTAYMGKSDSTYDRIALL